MWFKVDSLVDYRREDGTVRRGRVVEVIDPVRCVRVQVTEGNATPGHLYSQVVTCSASELVAVEEFDW